MVSTPRRAKRLESVISFCLLAVLVLIAIGVFLKQSDFDMSRFGVSRYGNGSLRRDEYTAASALSSQKSQTNSPEITLDALTPTGFETLSESETYTEENLYEKINGKAPLYIESGFRKLFTRRFVSKKDKDLWMELLLFDMGTAKNAFAVYSVQKRPDAETLQTMRFAYKTTNASYFAFDRYYVELVGSAQSQELLEAMLAVAGKIPSRLSVANDTEIVELRLFPQENVVPDSYKLHLTGAFGFEGLTDTFTARYMFGDNSLTAFFSRRRDTQDAHVVADSFYKFLIKNGGADKPPLNKNIE
ncbi:MAG: hypothetical protein MUP16_04150, partial [Sedimentisphaerales bacterium]|nr:hypothetical protein [Sedimentisphaerales bacterium]